VGTLKNRSLNQFKDLFYLKEDLLILNKVLLKLNIKELLL